LLGFDHFTTTVKAAWANVVAQMCFAGCGLNGGWGSGKRVVRVVHPTLAWGFFILLNSHDGTPELKNFDAVEADASSALGLPWVRIVGLNCLFDRFARPACPNSGCR
jgi:hypothetical protein